MFVPAAHETADDRRQVGRNGARILSHNTRLPEETEVTDDPSDWDAESVLSINSDATPTINGYKLIREPGTVKQGRNGVWRTRGFAIGETTPRERLARQLSTPTGNRKEAGKHEPSRSGKNSGSTAQKAAMLSPAALRLLRGTDEGDQAATPTQTRRDDHSLRKAYNSPYARRNPPTRHRRL
ncbi:hypothetical protein LPJ59_005910 [Coemansia sp. RSA 2399]|nr:hypothetical protein LPJ59_005910 [Coemansia sp. RSA 2399]KAJ1892979.1 hypothetical protein LPJ81_005448 [Coemansia sp. IMI 209127]